MTVFNFPDTDGKPTDGSFVWTAPNGTLYVWDGYSWTTKPGAISQDKNYWDKTGDILSPETPGDSVDLGTGNLDLEGNITAAGNVTSTSQNGGQLAGFRNQIINGDFSIWQRNTPFSGTPDLATRTYVTDRWASYSSAAARIDGPFGYAISVSGPSAAAAGNQNQLMQIVETLPGKSGPFINGSVWTISAWLATTDTAATASIGFVDSINGGNGSAEQTETLVSTGEVVGTWTRYSATFTINGTAAVSNVGFYVAITSGIATSYFANIQLEPGPVATPFEHRPMATELVMCQRYYQVHFILGKSVCMHNSDGANDAYTDLPLPAPMRIFGPTAGPDFKIGNAVATVGANSGLKGVQYADSACARLNMTKLGTASTGPNYVSLIGSGQDHFYLDAEL